MPAQEKSDKPRIDYPCRWSYKILGTGEAALRDTVAEVVREKEHTLSLSNTSRTGRYVALNLEMTVADEDERVSIYRALAAHPAVKMVL